MIQCCSTTMKPRMASVTVQRGMTALLIRMMLAEKPHNHPTLTRTDVSSLRLQVHHGWL